MSLFVMPPVAPQDGTAISQAGYEFRGSSPDLAQRMKGFSMVLQRNVVAFRI